MHELQKWRKTSMTKNEFLQICQKYNLVTKVAQCESNIYISAYLPGMVYEFDDVDNNSFADFAAESWDDENGRVKMYGGLMTEYNAEKHTTEYNYIYTIDTAIPTKFEQIVAGVMERYTAMKLLDKKENERTKLIKLQSDFV